MWLYPIKDPSALSSGGHHHEKKITMLTDQEVHRVTGLVANNPTVKPARNRRMNIIDSSKSAWLPMSKQLPSFMRCWKRSTHHWMQGVSTVKRAWMEIGWAAKKTRHGSMISDNNHTICWGCSCTFLEELDGVSWQSPSTTRQWH